MSQRRIVGAAVGALLGMFGVSSAMQPNMNAKAAAIAQAPQLRRSKRQVLRDYGAISHWSYPKNPPGTVAQAKRAAIKAKRRARHRAACRG